jgi:PAS domain S-box-containing protein
MNRLRASGGVLEPPDPALMEILPGGVVYLRTDGSIAAMNQEALRVLGLTPGDIVCRYARDFGPRTIGEDGQPFAVEDYPGIRALATGLPQGGVTIGIRRQDGATSWAVSSALPVFAGDDTVVGAVVTLLDITDRVHANRELERSRDLLRAAQRIMKVGSFEIDLATGHMEWTDEMFEIHGIARESFSGHVSAMSEMFHPDDLGRLMGRIEAARQGVTPTSLRLRVVRPNGELRTVWAGADLVCDERGKPLKLVGAVQDVTEQHALEEHLRQSQRLESLGRLAGGVAHDFNNLLQVILGSADIALRDPSRPQPLQEIQMAAQRAAQLTQQLLAFGRRQQVQPVELSLPELLDELLPLLRRMVGSGVQLLVEPHVDAPRVIADRSQLEQVLINLCLNARDAMPDGGTITVHTDIVAPDDAVRKALALREPGAHLRLQVRDTGTGMTEDVRARVFEPFYTTKSSGTGLGLAVVYGIVQQHRGGIEVLSALGQGTTMIVYLPVESPRDGES